MAAFAPALPGYATTAQGIPTKLAVGRDMHVDRRCARGIRILSGTARARIDAPFACWNVGVFPLIRKRSSSLKGTFGYCLTNSQGFSRAGDAALRVMWTQGWTEQGYNVLNDAYASHLRRYLRVSNYRRCLGALRLSITE